MSRPWTTFLEAVDAARVDLGFEDREECFFRGHAESSWELLPSLLRHCRKAKLKTASEIRDLESVLFFEFRARARELHVQPLEDWDVLFHMQHHRLATRLLDWTEVLGIAVYFALRDAQAGSSSPCVWLLNPYRLNQQSWEVRDLVAPEYLPQGDYTYADYLVDYSESRGFDWDEPVALYPLQRSARLHAQRGYFTIAGEDLRPLEKIMPSVTRRIVLPEPAWKDARRFLDDAGINEHLLFPDLDGLTRHLQDKYMK